MKYKGEKHISAEYSSPYPVSRLAPPTDLVDLAREIEAADDILSMQAVGKLKLLAGQIDELRITARKILEETQWNQRLHRARCSFKKVVGASYHLYQDKKGELLLSMIGPEEWGRTEHCTALRFVGTYRLEHDQRWTLMDEQEKDYRSGNGNNVDESE